MSGPALRKVTSHEAIHDAALQEARELTNIIENLMKNNDRERALQVALIAIEHWETRTLAHAEAEEEGLYLEIASESEEKKRIITQLIRDHDLMRRIVAMLKDQLIHNGITEHSIKQLHTLIIIDEYHNADEMKVLPNH
ncbi:hypothetical protein ACFOZ1_03600 [Gracilibacillus marinus]|jgi:hypothetical protein|uniref:Hemerythrin-like domain-containing protein n=1 Tax=Gracilibacillus marinus TaxID=630535 RepID=A0ABV8VRQ1_9BACI